MSLVIWVPLSIFVFIFGWKGLDWFGNKFYLGFAIFWIGLAGLDAFNHGPLFLRTMDVLLSIACFAMWWRNRPPKDRGKLRRAIGARMQAVIDRMTEIARPVHGNSHA